MGQPFHVTIAVTNQTKQAHILTASVAESETFLLAGARFTHFDVPPGAKQLLRFVLVPVTTGLVRLIVSGCCWCVRSSLANGRLTQISLVCCVRQLLLPEVKFRSKRLQDAPVGGGRDYTSILVLPAPATDTTSTAAAATASAATQAVSS